VVIVILKDKWMKAMEEKKDLAVLTEVGEKKTCSFFLG